MGNTEDTDEYGLTKKDWNAINSTGPPKVIINSKTGLTTVIHGDGMEVVSHKTVEEYGFVYLFVKTVGQILMVPVALVRAFHGDPCEKQSRQVGGDGYNRVKK
jgi:hypothetical protein